MTAASPKAPRSNSSLAARGAPLLVSAALMAAFTASRLAIHAIPSEREYDEGVYLLSARSLLAGHELFSSVFSSQPPAFLESLAMAMRIGGDNLASARLLILGFSVVALAAIGFVGRRIAGPWAGAASVAALAVTGTFVDLAHIVEAEMPAMAVALLALGAVLQARRLDWHRGWLLGSGALLALGALFKLLVVPLAAPLGLLLLLAPPRGDETDWELDGRGRALIGRVAGRSLWMAAGAAMVGVVPLLLYDIGPLYEQTVAFHVDKHDVYRSTPFGNLLRAARHMRADEAVAAVAAIGFVLMLLRKRPVALWLLAWIALMLVVLAVQAPLFWRHFILLTPPIALAAGAAAPLLARYLPGPGAVVLTLVAIALWIATALSGQGRRGDASFPLLPGSEKRDYSVSLLKDVSQWIREHTDASEMVVSDDPISVFLAGRQAPPAICDTSSARIKAASLTLEEATRESSVARVIVLRKSGRLSQLRGYVAWVNRHYEQQPASVTGINPRRSIWIRRDSGPADSP